MLPSIDPTSSPALHTSVAPAMPVPLEFLPQAGIGTQDTFQSVPGPAVLMAGPARAMATAAGPMAAPAPAAVPSPPAASPTASSAPAATAGVPGLPLADPFPSPFVDRVFVVTPGAAVKEVFTTYEPDRLRFWTDEEGGRGRLFTTIDRHGALWTAVDGRGRVRLQTPDAVNTAATREVLVDEARQRLTVLRADEMVSYDLRDGSELARRKVPQDPSFSLAVGPEGRIYASGQDGVRCLDPNLEDSWVRPLPDLRADHVSVLADGSILATGSLVRVNGKWTSDFDRHFAILSPDGEIRIAHGTSQTTPTVGPDGNVYGFHPVPARVVRVTPDGGQQDIPLQPAVGESFVACERVIPLPGGAFLTVADGSSRPRLSVFTATGEHVKTVAFPRCLLEHLVVTPDGSRAWVTTHHILPPQNSTDLRAVDLTAPPPPPAPRGGGGRVATVDPAPPPLYSHAKVFVPALLDDGRLLLASPAGDALLGANGVVEAQYGRAGEAERNLGASTRVDAGPDHPREVDTFLRKARGRFNATADRRMVEMAVDCTPSSLQSPSDAVHEASDRARLERTLWSTSPWDPSQPALFFPDGTRLPASAQRMETFKGHVVTAPEGETFTTMLPVVVGGNRYVAVGVSDGTFHWVDADGRFEPRDASCRLPAAVVRTWLDERGVVCAQAADGSSLQFFVAREAHETPTTFTPAPVTIPAGGTVHQEEDGSHVWVGGVRLERRNAAEGGSPGVKATGKRPQAALEATKSVKSTSQVGE